MRVKTATYSNSSALMDIIIDKLLLNINKLQINVETVLAQGFNE